jgi:signal transduction histidine kinase
MPLQLRRLAPSTHLWLVAAIAAACLLFVSLNSLRVLKQRVVAEREARVRATVRTAHELIRRLGGLAEAGVVTREQAQRAAIDALRGVTNEASDYFWISDLDRRLVMHPSRSSLEGSDLGDFRDEQGKPLLGDFITPARSPAGEGFVSYRWPRPGGGAPARKVAFVKLYQPFGWVIASGTYLDDIDASIAVEARRVLASTVLVALILCGVGGALAWNLRRADRLESAQRRAEELARRHDRALRTLSACNEALVRATDEQALLDGVCRIVVEVGGYRFAWVGFAEADERKTVRPVARAGFEDGYLAGADIVWADTDRGRGPVGTAIRTGQPSLFRDSASDPGFEPWRAAALARGYRSSLGLPLLAEGKPFGALTIYAAEHDRFDDPDERKLLVELADDLAYGLVALRARADRARMTAQLMQADRLVAMGTLAAGVAHEINNPLSYVLGGLDFVQREADALSPAVPPAVPGERLAEVREVLREMRDGCERIRQAVRDLKAFSRGDEESRQPLDLRRILEMSISMATNEIRHRARLVKEYGAAPVVEANEARLGQVFLNLLINAAQAIPDGAAEANEIRVTTRADGAGRAVVEIRDSGCGISPENLARIFDPFFTTKPIGVGTGLGLSICQRVILTVGGAIEVESEVGRGSLFRVTLPAAPVAKPCQPAGAAPVASARPRARVLAIDDEPYVASAIRRALAPEFEVVHESSASAALARLASGEHVDVVLCDLMMPEKSGIDFHEELAQRDPALAAHVVFLTGGGFTPAAQAFLDATKNMVLEKPFEKQQLRAAVQRLLG